MATKRWRGDAPAVAQVSHYTPANVEVGDIFTLTCNGKTISVTAAAATVASVVGLLVTALTDTTIAEFREVTPTNGTTHLVLTANDAGIPFTITSSATDGGGANTQTFTASTPIANSGPNNWDVAANWEPSGVPATGDVVYFDNGSSPCLYGLNQSAVQLLEMHVRRSYSGRIGLPRVNNSGTGYIEYRPTYLAVGATALFIGDGSGSGSSFLKIDVGSALSVTQVYYTAAPNSGQDASLFWKGSNSNNGFEIYQGYAHIAMEPGESADIDTLTVGYTNNQTSDAILRIGNCVPAVVKQYGGLLQLYVACDDIDISGGQVNVRTGNMDAVNVWGSGQFYYDGNGTITTLVVGGSGQAHFTRGIAARTITNCQLNIGATLMDNGNTCTFTNPIELLNCSLQQVTLNLGTHQTVAVAAI